MKVHTFGSSHVSTYFLVIWDMVLYAVHFSCSICSRQIMHHIFKMFCGSEQKQTQWINIMYNNIESLPLIFLPHISPRPI